MKPLVVIITLTLLVGCGKLKISDSNQNVNISDARVDVVHAVDLASMEKFFRPGCEAKYKAIEDEIEREDKVLECVATNSMNVWDSILAQSNGATE